MFDKKFLSNQLKSLRKELKLSQEEFGAKLGVGNTAISMIEKGDRATSLELFATICDTFNVTPDYFLGRGIFSKLDLVEEVFDILSNAVCNVTINGVKIKDFYYDLPHYKQLCLINSFISDVSVIDNSLQIDWRIE